MIQLLKLICEYIIVWFKIKYYRIYKAYLTEQNERIRNKINNMR